MRRVLISRLERLAAPRRQMWDAAYFLAAAILFYLPLVLGVATFEAGDFPEHFLPYAQFLQAEIAAGRLPLWNPYAYAGQPFLADIQAGVYFLPSYPFYLAGLLAGSASDQLYWLQWEAIVHTALAGFGMYRLLLALTGTRRAGAVAGMAFMLSGYITGYAPLQLAVLRSAVWLPFAMTALWQGIHAPRQVRAWLAAAFFCALIILGGHAQTALYAAYLLAAWLVVGVWTARVFQPGNTRANGMKSQLALGVGLAGVGFGTLGLSAGQLIPSLEFLNQSVRAQMGYAALSGGLALRDTWQMVLPQVFTQFSPLYTGIVGLVFALVAMIGALWGNTGNELLRGEPGEPRVGVRPLAIFFLFVVLFGLLASLGDNAPLYPALYASAPGWDLFRGQERAAYLVVVGLAALAGLAVAWIPSAGRTLRKRSALILGGLVTVLVYSFGLLYQLLGATAIGDYHYLWIAFYTLALGLAACLFLWIDGWSRARSTLLILLVAFNLWLANVGINLEWVSPASRTATPAEVVALQDALADDLHNTRLHGRVYNEFRLYENYGITHTIEDVWGASPLRLAAYDQLFDDFPLDRMWTLTAVEYVLTWRGDLFGPSELLAEFPQETDTTYLHRLPEPMPRAWAVEQVAIEPRDEIVARLADHEIDLRTMAYMAAEHRGIQAFESANVEIEDSQTWAAALVTVRHAEPGRLLVEVDAAGPAFVILSENWLSGKVVASLRCGESLGATGDACLAGEQFAPLPWGLTYFEPVPVNLTLIGVAVPGGLTQFELAYQPASVWIGGFISGITLSVIIAIGTIARIRRPRTAKTYR